MRACDIAWAAGFFEGEGSFIVSKKKKPSRPGYIYRILRLQLKNTDLEAITKFSELVGACVHGPYGSKNPNASLWYYCELYGIDANRIASLFKPFLSKKRLEKLNVCLNDIEENNR